jgi:Ni2+-binding GTPase involved in maturation of urease and hydrogenase
LFLSAPTVVVAPGAGATSTIATVVLNMGSKFDIAVIQPGP